MRATTESQVADLARLASELSDLLLEFGNEPSWFVPNTDAPWGRVLHANLLSDLRAVRAWAEAQEAEAE